MKSITEVELQQKALSFLLRPDDRPKLLKDLTAIAQPTERYNRFLFEFAREFIEPREGYNLRLYESTGKMQPGLTLETGTDRGRSAAHFALGSPSSTVITIDIDQACKNNVDELKIQNIVSIAADSLAFADSVHDGAIGILFLDSLHTYDHTMAEWRVYQKKVMPGGIAFFDDIHLDAGMEKFWSEVQGRKVDLSQLHCSGFGAVLL